MSRPFLILQLRPEDDTSDNEFSAILKYSGLDAADTHRIRIEKNGIPDDLVIENYSGIIVGGSPFDISTPAGKKTEIQKKIEADFRRLFDVVIPNDIPFLGACSGNGLLGSYLGTNISNQYGEAVGCVTLDITDQGKLDPLLSGFPDQIDVMLGHKEACDSLPRGATLLMTGYACPVQMFRVGNNVYATQFHPEADSRVFETRVKVYKDKGYFPPSDADRIIEFCHQQDVRVPGRILKNFVDAYR